MKNVTTVQYSEELNQLCTDVRKLVLEENYTACEEIIFNAMEKFPHAPQPHNLLGILLEITGDHPLAMRHFRAAWALDPTYLPANHNLNTYGAFESYGTCAFDENDIPSNSHRAYN